MKRLQKFGIGFGLFLLFIVLSAMGTSNFCQAKGVASLDAVVLGQTKVKLTWRTHANISRIQIFREEMADAGYNRTKIATLKGGKESYVDTIRPDREYEYQIVAYKKKGKKYKKIGSGSCFTFNDGKVEWDEYAHCDAYTTSKSIRLDFGMEWRPEGKVPSGYEIFRSVDEKRYECIKSVSVEQNWFRYTDTTVQSHQKYYYKARAFWKSGKKKNAQRQYSAFSGVMEYTAENSYGTYSVKVLTEEGDALSSLTVCLTSDAGNGDFTFDYRYAFGDLYNGESRSPLACTQYSYDGKKWFPPGDERMVLKAGQSMYLQLTGYMGETLSYWKGKKVVIEEVYGRYHNLAYILSIDLVKLTARASLDAELYH